MCVCGGLYVPLCWGDDPSLFWLLMVCTPETNHTQAHDSPTPQISTPAHAAPTPPTPTAPAGSHCGPPAHHVPLIWGSGQDHHL